MMMEKITFDAGVKRYRINGGGVLQFNPADPNLYQRFMEAVEQIKQLEQEMAGGDEEPLAKLCRVDGQIKKILSWVFGGENDFDALLGGVNLLAAASNGQPVVSNLLQALLPVLTEGARMCAGVQVQQAKEKAQSRRQSQC